MTIWEILRLSILQKEKVCSGSNTKDVTVKLFAEELMGGAERAVREIPNREKDLTCH